MLTDKRQKPDNRTKPLERTEIVFADFMLVVLINTKISFGAPGNFGKYQVLNTDSVYQFAEVGGIHTKVASQVFLRYQTQDMRAALEHFSELLL